MGLFDNLSSEVSSAWNNVTSTGAPAVIAGVEQYGASILTQQATQSTAQAQAALAQVASQPGSSSGIMQSIESSFKNIVTTQGLKTYGPYIIIGLIAVLYIGKKVL